MEHIEDPCTTCEGMGETKHPTHGMILCRDCDGTGENMPDTVEFTKMELANIVSDVAYARGILEQQTRDTDRDFSSEVERLQKVTEKITSKIGELENQDLDQKTGGEP